MYWPCLYFSPHLGHSGEANITRGAWKEGIIQMVSSNASLSYAQIMAAAAPSQTLFFQLYKNKDDTVAEARVREVEQLGYKAIFLTVDAIVAGNREADIRSPWTLEDQESGTAPVWDENAPVDEINLGGTAGALVNNDDRDMTWEKASFQPTVWLMSVVKHCIDYSMAKKADKAAYRNQR
jgi:L-lactate dehydrogenase (cytochrome)